IFSSPTYTPPPTSQLFPYTTLFRSTDATASAGERQRNPHPAPSGQDGWRGRYGGPWLWSAAGVLRRGNGNAAFQPGTHLARMVRSEEHTSELQSLTNLVCRLLLEKK